MWLPIDLPVRCVGGCISRAQAHHGRERFGGGCKGRRMRLTDSQQQAIRQRGNVLVVAGAGTGKTSTLVHRCVALLLEENCSLEQILMVTFTEAAAAEMRSRIRAQLLKLQAGLPAESAQTEKARQQLALLDTANICTLHSFCLQLIRAHFYQLGLDPALHVLDEKQTGPIIASTLDGLFTQYYASDSPAPAAVHDLIRQVGGGSEERIRERILRLHRYTQALEDPETWFLIQEKLWQSKQPFAWREWFQTAFAPLREEWLGALRPFALVQAVSHCIQSLSGLSEKPAWSQIATTLHER